jgi:hypothetical protein
MSAWRISYKSVCVLHACSLHTNSNTHTHIHTEDATGFSGAQDSKADAEALDNENAMLEQQLRDKLAAIRQQQHLASVELRQVHTHTHTNMCIYIYTCKNGHMHAHMRYTCTHTHTHTLSTYMHTCPYAYTYIPMRGGSLTKKALRCKASSSGSGAIVRVRVCLVCGCFMSNHIIRTHIHIYALIHTYTRTHTHTHALTHTYTRSYTYTCTLTHIHTLVYIYTFSCVYTHTHTCNFACLQISSTTRPTL